MRERRERRQIELQYTGYQGDGTTLKEIMQELQLEVLLDIRDLLQSLQPPIIITTGGDSDDRDKGLRNQNHQHP